MHKYCAILLLMTGCGEETVPGECEPGFVKKQGRWCVFDEAALQAASDADDDSEGNTSTPGDPDGDEDQTDPGEYIHESDPVVPQLGLPEIEAAVLEGIRTIHRIDPADVHQIYQNIQGDGDASCPDYDEERYEETGQDYWRDACTVGAGASFAGYAYSYNYGDYSSGGYNYAHHAYYGGSARLVDSRGYVFTGSGSSTHYERTYESTGDTTVYLSMSGNYRYDDPAYADTWLTEDLNINVYVSATQYAPSAYISGGFSSYYNASISGINGPVNTLRLSSIYMYSSSLGSLCELEPSGFIELRDSAGVWYRVEFHGPKYYGGPSFPPDCDGCGPVYSQGQYLGDVCVDFSELANWDGRPW